MEPDDLPLALPEKMKFDAAHASPEPPLDAAPEDWLYVTLDGVRYKRETNTMPQWAGSCWYYLRFLDPGNDQALIDPEIEKAWMPVDLYVGGAEHAVLHLLYARFWHKVLFDCGLVQRVLMELLERMFLHVMQYVNCTILRAYRGYLISVRGQIRSYLSHRKLTLHMISIMCR